VLREGGYIVLRAQPGGPNQTKTKKSAPLVIPNINTRAFARRRMVGKQMNGEFVPMLNELSSTPWTRMEKWRYSSTTVTSSLDGAEWSASRPCRFTLREKSPQYPLHRRLGGPQSRSARYGEERREEKRRDETRREVTPTEPSQLQSWQQVSRPGFEQSSSPIRV
jgi:hypothetical protein